MLRIMECFGGIGACSKALERLGVDFEVVEYVEIDKHAVKSFNAIHSTNFEPQDVCEWDKDIKVDLIMHGSPCTNISLAGKQEGADKGSGTQSSLMYETLRIVEKLKPKYVVWENVKNLLGKKHRHNFDNYISQMNELGYRSFYEILNSKNFGVPQNRERVFTVSIRKDLDADFVFPQKQELKLKLRDLLDQEVDEKYYLTPKNIKHYSREFGSKGKECNPDGCSPTLQAAMGAGGGNIPLVNTCIQVAQIYGGGKEPNPQAGRIYDLDGSSPTLDSCCGGNRMPKFLEGARIRKLTPKECWRLMGFDDSDFEKAEKVNSNTQLYKQAGNSIVVNVLEAILKNLLKNS